MVLPASAKHAYSSTHPILVVILPRRSRQAHSSWREARGRHAAKKPAGFWRRNVSLGAAAPAGLVAKVVAWAT